ncbi:MAG: tetratricopeptide repeat protein [Candidatus Gastranaerophilales bacterium]|nr:tetratricopeptide repeat protein [Candidatus Gastranaerophilales bacterium]
MKKFLILIFLIYVLIGISASSFAQEDSTFIKPQQTGIEELKKQGITFYKWGKYLEALDCFEKIDKNSLNTEILILMANCYESLNNSNKASELLIKSIESNPKNSFSYYNLGILHYKNNNIDEAINNFKKAVKYNQNFTAAYYNLGVCYYSFRNYNKAKDCFISAIKLDPDNTNICYNLVLTFNSLNDKKTAEKYLDIYSKMSEKNKVTDTDGINTLKNVIKPVQLPSNPKGDRTVSDIKQNSFWQNLNFKKNNKK